VISCQLTHLCVCIFKRRFLVYLEFVSKFKGVESHFYVVFRSDPKLFTDDTDIKYCKALNCCKLPKVSAEISFVLSKKEVCLLMAFLIFGD